MSRIHVRHIKTYLENTYKNLIDLSDQNNKPDVEREKHFLSRALASFTIQQFTDIEPKAAALAVTDGFDDNGIDALHFDQVDNTFYVVQSKWIESGSGSIAVGDVHKLVQGVKDLLDAKFDRFNDKVKKKEKSILAALESAQVKFVILLAYTGLEPLSTHAQAPFTDLKN